MEGRGERIIAYCTPAGFCINMEQEEKKDADKVVHLKGKSWTEF